MLEVNENVEVVEEVEENLDFVDNFNDDLNTLVEKKEEENFDTDIPSEEVEETETVETKEEVTEESTEEVEKFVLKHFEGDKEVTKEELTALGQKGLDYDRVKTQVQELRPTHDKIEKLAKLYEYEDLDKFIDDLYSSYDQRIADEQEVSPESVKFNREAEEKNRLADERLEQINKKETEHAEYNKFLSEFGDVKAEDIKPETWQKVQEGKSLNDAYREQLKQEQDSSVKNELEELKKELAILKTQKTITTPGGIGTKTDSNKQESYLDIWDE